MLGEVHEGNAEQLKELIRLVERHWTIHDQMAEGEEPSHWEDMMSNLMRDRFSQAEDGIRDQPRSRGLGDVYKRQKHHVLPVRWFLTFCHLVVYCPMAFD